VPYIGYTFSEAWGAQSTGHLDRFVAASRQARAILASSDAEWERIAPMTGATNRTELERLREWYRHGIPQHWGEPERRAAEQLFKVLADLGGPDLVGPITTVPSGTFWPINW